MPHETRGVSDHSFERHRRTVVEAVPGSSIENSVKGIIFQLAAFASFKFRQNEIFGVC